MNGINIEEVVKPLIEDELENLMDNEKVLYTLTPEQIEAYLDFASYYNAATRLKEARKNGSK